MPDTPSNSSDQSYMAPYADAYRRHGEAFGSLLWLSPQSQALRFEAIVRLYDFRNRNVLDAGCGRADLLEFLIRRELSPAHYTGLEAFGPFAAAARAKRLPKCLIVEADFVHEPARLFVGADAIIFCGSLNTMSRPQFHATLRHAFDAAVQVVLFNFLCSGHLAAASWLTWHELDHVRDFCRQLSPRVSVVDDYLEGDCTIAVWKEPGG